MITRAAPTDGKILWHSHIGQVSNAPETYMLDAHQYLLVAAGDTLFSFTLY
jgi:alcohol dehydrogenase (cytochrome c)